MSATPPLPDIACGRLSVAEYAANFSDAHPPLNAVQARLEADRCYYCHDAPCTTACPTGIDIPTFIARIAQDNLRGAARTILEENALGGMCARVCPTEILCEQACVRNTNEEKPVEIGLLQRFATDGYFAKPGAPLFTRAPASGRQVAVVGGGPAGLSCAHRLAVLGHAVTLFDAKLKLGGLNEYGIASYKTTGGFAQKEVDWLLSIGGITVKSGQRLGRDVSLDALVQDFDAVFLGLGLAGVNAVGIAEPAEAPLRAAVDFIAELRQSNPADVSVGRKVVVIGGGMTAVDAAVQSRLLGAEDVTIVYRRGPQGMSASGYEQEWAQTNGVKIKHWGAPKEVVSEGGRVCGMRFVRTRMDGVRLIETDEHFTLDADVVLKAIGQTFVAEPVAGSTEKSTQKSTEKGAPVRLALDGGGLATDDDGQTSHPKVWAGGDCRAGGRDLTVEAVEHGKRSAIAIDRRLRA